MDDHYTDIHDIVAFDERLTTLAGLIGSIARPGDYCCHGRQFAPMPRVEAGAAGLLSFPIPEAQLRTLVAGAERAPYGRGEETLIDRSVRDCWQIAPEELSIGGRTWAETFDGILDRTVEGLGCPKGSVAAELYKLLIYEPGGFFAPHRDTEKADGMVATLVISLPVAGAGGDLVIRHGGRETVVDMRTDEPSELIHAAFYADCEHEILPVTDGHRVCLVYNLILQDGAAAASAPDYSAEIASIAAELEARCRDPGASGKLVWMLEHDYSAAGLSFGTLKNVDAAVGRVLSAAAERADCALHAAVVHVEERGSTWYDGYDRVVEDPDEDDFSDVEIYQVSCWLDGWTRPDGAPADYGKLPLLAGDLMPVGRLDPQQPDSRLLTEATGNAGATIERLYLRAALVVWPKTETPRVLAPAGAGSLAAFLAEEQERASTGAPTAAPVGDLASQVVDAWPSPKGLDLLPNQGSWKERSASTLEVLSSIGNRAATTRFLSAVVMPNYSGEFNAALVVAAPGAGAVEMGGFLCALVSSNLSSQPEEIIDLASRLCTRLDDGRDGAWRDALREMAAIACAEMPSIEVRVSDDERARLPGWRATNAAGPLPATALQQFFALLWRLELESEAGAVAALLAKRRDLLAPDRATPVVLDELFEVWGDKAGTSPAFATLWRHGAEFLLSRSNVPPRPPADWTIPVDNLRCDCEYCARLRQFCANPDAKVLRIPVRQELRRHLMRKIDDGRIDMRYETEEKGRPYSLVCTKTRGAYERRLQQYSEDIAGMRRLARTAEAVPGSAELAERLRTAIGEQG